MEIKDNDISKHYDLATVAGDVTIATDVYVEQNASITTTPLIDHTYVSKLFLWMLIWASFILVFIWVIDPYGVSPISLSLPGINTYKTKRIDIDRLIKPYEVWRYQPKTIFLGTSRIHQSMDPAVLDGTDFAPAYNAAVPASTVSQNVSNLEEYFRLDKNLKNVFIELFIYNFIFPQPLEPKKSLREFLEKYLSLNLSADAFFNAMQTIKFNQSGQAIGPYIGPRGNWIRPAGFNTNDTFNKQLNIDTIINIHKSIPDMLVQPSVIAALDRIVALCKKHHAKLYMFITPSYPWDDYRLLSLGYWPLLEEWLNKMSHYDNVYSFAQYNALIDEAPGEKMKWWNDPIHFSRDLGKLMLMSLLGTRDDNIPQNLIRPLTPTTLQSVLLERKHGLNSWVNSNHDYPDSFDHAKLVAGNAERHHQ